ncbi:MAG TPA: cation diffusion facilitator family transporter [Tenuifilaceae bacterium]|nr:cation diffusion facilitator family transporter [Tenuifilaceae bacterium]HOZ15094.1 cation diffusion facilitator family transporter [Tenuifilaceae bacterium]HPN21048.1 cation diffusion facilitator family transporter [Tenuifilaceae bacterium]
MGEHQIKDNTVALNRAFIIGIVINILYVVVEIAAGIYYSSLSLISDAGHNLSDVASLGLAMLAFRLAKRKANDKFTYGYKKSTILVSLINSVILFVAIGGILWESINRVFNPVVVDGQAISIVAGVGIVVNTVSALLFFKNKDHDLNVKGAYLHLMADAAVSLGVVASGVFIAFWSIYWLDLAMSLVIVAVIFYSTWNLFKESLSLTIDGVPSGINLSNISSLFLSVDGVKSVYHIHIWALSTTQNAITAQVIVDSNLDLEGQNRIRQKIKEQLNKENIQHITLEISSEHNTSVDCKV